MSDRSALRWQIALDKQRFADGIREREEKILSGEIDHSAHARPTQPEPEPEPTQAPMPIQDRNMQAWDARLKVAISANNGMLADAIGAETGQMVKDLRHEIADLRLIVDVLRAEIATLQKRGWFR